MEGLWVMLRSFYIYPIDNQKLLKGLKQEKSGVHFR